MLSTFHAHIHGFTVQLASCFRLVAALSSFMRFIPTSSIPTLSIPIWSMLTKWELTKWEVDEVGKFTIVAFN